MALGWVLMMFDDFGEEFLEGHGSGVGGLGRAHELGLDVGWDEFDDFDVGGLELVAEGLRCRSGWRPWWRSRWG